MELGRDRLQEDAEALADAQADGEHEKTAPNGGPVRTGGHAATLRWTVGPDKTFATAPSIELLHAATSSDVAQHSHGPIVATGRSGGRPYAGAEIGRASC